MFDDFDHACKLARRNRFRQGRYLVKVVIPDDSGVEFKKTFGEHHYTIYAKPDEILPYAEREAVPILDALGD